MATAKMKGSRFNAERYEHILVLLTRRQSIEGKGEDFLCLYPEKIAKDSCNQSTRYPLANLILLPSRFSFTVGF